MESLVEQLVGRIEQALERSVTQDAIDAAEALVRAVVVSNASLSGVHVRVEAIARTAPEPIPSHVLRCMGQHANRTGEPEMFAALERLHATDCLLDVSRAPMPRKSVQYMLDRASKLDTPADWSKLGNWLQDAARFGTDISPAIPVLLAQLGKNPSGRGYQRVDPAQRAMDALVRCALDAAHTKDVCDQLEALCSSRGKVAADALETLMHYWTWTAAFARVDEELRAPKLSVPVASGFCSGVYSRIFFGEIGDGPPSPSWIEAVSQRLPDVERRIPKASERIAKLAANQLETAKRRLGRANNP